MQVWEQQFRAETAVNRGTNNGENEQSVSLVVHGTMNVDEPRFPVTDRRQFSWQLGGINDADL